MRSARVQILLGVGISLLLVAWLVWSIDWGVAFQEMRRLNFIGVILLTLALLLNQVLRAWRWRYFLPGDGAPFLPLFAGLMIGNLATFLLPLRAGEFIRPYVLSRVAQVPFAIGFTSVVIERFFDLTCVLILFAVLLPYLPGLPGWALNGAYLLAVLAATIAVLIVLALTAERSLRACVVALSRFLPKVIAQPVSSALNGFLDGCGVLRSPERIAFVVGGTILCWLSNVFVYLAGLYALDIPLDFVFATAISIVLALAVAAPSAPGFIGVYQTACIATFVIFSVAKELGAAYAVITHLHQYVVYIVVGVLLLARFELKLLDLWRSARR